MKTAWVTGIVLTVFGLGTAVAAEKKLKLEELPPAVQATVKAETKNATVGSISKETEKGKTLYEVETKVDGKGRDLTIDEKGVVVEVEQEVSIDTIPAAAKAAMEKAATGGKILKVETVTRGKTVTYEATIQKNGKKSERAFAADGTPVKDE